MEEVENRHGWKYVDIVRPESVRTHDKRTGKPNGSLTSLWRDWDAEDSAYGLPPDRVGQVYMTTCEPGGVKGPHLHNKRLDRFVCLKGSVVFVTRTEHGEYKEYKVSEGLTQVVLVPPGMPSMHYNVGTEDALVLNICDSAWHPDDMDDHEVDAFEDYWETVDYEDRPTAVKCYR